MQAEQATEQCRLCGKVFGSFLALYQHVDREHADHSDAYWSVEERTPARVSWNTDRVEPEVIDIDEVTN